MYIFKNALRSISRSKGRWILISIIVLVICVSVCISLSIRQAAQTSKEELLDSLEVSATIEFDRTSMMNDMKDKSDGGDFDKDEFKEMASEFSSSPDLDELEEYAKSSNVKSFFYTLTTSVNGTDDFEAVDTTTVQSDSDNASSDTNTDNAQAPDANMQNGMGGGDMSRFGTQGDFQLVGYSSDEAMTDFISGTSSISAGAVFDEGTSDYDCIISEELATYNSISVDDKITVTNPNNEDEEITLTVVGIYSSSQGSEQGGMSFNLFDDSANKILMSYTALKAICDDSSETSGDSALSTSLSPTYTFATVDNYEAFSEEVYDLGLDEQYTVTSSDYNSYEQSLTPINNLQNFSLYFLIIVLIIGAIILSVINIFNIRERKYEIGVMSAIGMKKKKIALQFIIEMLVVTMITVIIGTAIGAVASVPVGNALLSAQTTSEQSQQDMQNESFGREAMPSGDNAPSGENSLDIADKGSDDKKSDDNAGGPSTFVSQIHASTNLTVFFELMAIAILLSLLSSGISVIFVLRYDPLKILSNRD